jgi:hypothetical protein
LLTTWDADGNGCGYNETTKDYPYLYYPVIDPASLAAADPTADPTGAVSQVLAFGICVSECPKQGEDADCVKPTFITNQANHYVGCVYSIVETDKGYP